MTFNSGKYAPIFDVNPVTGGTFEVFYADKAPDTLGVRRAGWFWWSRRRGFSPESPAVGPFPTSYSAYRDATSFQTDVRFGVRRVSEPQMGLEIGERSRDCQ
jgi:hypothetical protein